MSEIILARHGDTEKLVNGVPTRHDKDRSLSPDGIKNVHKQGRHLKNNGVQIDVMLCGPSLRTRQTAEIITEYFPTLFPNVHNELGEIRRYVSGMPYNSLENDEYVKKRARAFQLFDTSWKYKPTDESVDDVRMRITSFKRYLETEFTGQNILLVGHSQPFVVFHDLLINGPRSTPKQTITSYRTHFLKPAHYSIYDFNYRTGWKLISFNQPE